MERQDKVVLTLDSYEHGIMIRALNELRYGNGGNDNNKINL